MWNSHILLLCLFQDINDDEYPEWNYVISDKCPESPRSTFTLEVSWSSLYRLPPPLCSFPLKQSIPLARHSLPRSLQIVFVLDEGRSAFYPSLATTGNRSSACYHHSIFGQRCIAFLYTHGTLDFAHKLMHAVLNIKTVLSSLNRRGLSSSSRGICIRHESTGVQFWSRTAHFTEGRLSRYLLRRDCHLSSDKRQADTCSRM